MIIRKIFYKDGSEKVTEIKIWDEASSYIRSGKDCFGKRISKFLVDWEDGDGVYEYFIEDLRDNLKSWRERGVVGEYNCDDQIDEGYQVIEFKDRGLEGRYI